MARSGLIIVDKPTGLTSHDVVARVRRIAGTRRVGHAGTLDPMATGVLVIGVERATRLLTYLVGCDKTYAATMRLGQTTITDDAEGDVLTAAEPERLTEAALPVSAISEALLGQTGPIEQVPSAVSAIKIRGVRSYARVRAGQEVTLAARPVTVHRLTMLGVRRTAGWIDVDVEVRCSAGTYVRALARDVGAGLGVGAHLVALRRTDVGTFGQAESVTLAALADATDPVSIPLAQAVARVLPRREASLEEAALLSHGGRLSGTGQAGPVGVFDPAGEVVAIVVDRAGCARPEVVFAPAGARRTMHDDS